MEIVKSKVMVLRWGGGDSMGLTRLVMGSPFSSDTIMDLDIDIYDFVADRVDYDAAMQVTL